MDYYVGICSLEYSSSATTSFAAVSYGSEDVLLVEWTVESAEEIVVGLCTSKYTSATPC